jgi:hypothetical protein
MVRREVKEAEALVLMMVPLGRPTRPMTKQEAIIRAFTGPCRSKQFAGGTNYTWPGRVCGISSGASATATAMGELSTRFVRPQRWELRNTCSMFGAFSEPHLYQSPTGDVSDGHSLSWPIMLNGGTSDMSESTVEPAQPALVI